MATVKGTWRFNETLTPVNFAEPDVSVGASIQQVNYNIINYAIPNQEDQNFTGFMYTFSNYGIGDLRNVLGFSFRTSTYFADLYAYEVDGVSTHKWVDWDTSTYISDEPAIINFGTTEQEVSNEFYEWFIANATPQAKAKTFKKLYVGDTVATSGTRVFKKLTTEEPVTAGLFDADDNLVASWDVLVNTYGMDVERDNTNYKTDTASPYYVFTNNSELSAGTKLVIGNGVTSIGKAAFALCANLVAITIPDGVTSIGNGAFHSCTNLVAITIPDGVTSIETNTFYQCTSLTSVTIPKSVTSIGANAFYQCTSLTSVTIPKSVTSIGVYAFYQCTSLTSVTIPKSVTSIGNSAFHSCTNLVAITIPDGVTSIETNTFYKCTSLTSVTIPKSVTSIGNGAFSYCANITDVYYRGTAGEWTNIDTGGNGFLTRATIHYNYTG